MRECLLRNISCEWLNNCRIPFGRGDKEKGWNVVKCQISSSFLSLRLLCVEGSFVQPLLMDRGQSPFLSLGRKVESLGERSFKSNLPNASHSFRLPLQMLLLHSFGYA